MNEDTADQLERFLDGMMSEKESQAFLKTIDPVELRKHQEAQGRIDDSLKRMFQMEALDTDELHQQAMASFSRPSLTAGLNHGSATDLQTRRGFSRLAVAAMALIVSGLAIWFMSDPLKTIEPVFVPSSVVTIYKEAVDRGFRPYYECKDDQRFADWFQKHQGHALALAEMPAGRRMLGLSRLGGMGHDTSAMLCEVDGKKVMVFVDVVEKGKPIVSDDPDLNVFTQEINGLLFCEVTPLDQPTMTQCFEFID
jgi:hypothetical protein